MLRSNNERVRACARTARRGLVVAMAIAGTACGSATDPTTTASPPLARCETIANDVAPTPEQIARILACKAKQ